MKVRAILAMMSGTMSLPPPKRPLAPGSGAVAPPRPPPRPEAKPKIPDDLPPPRPPLPTDDGYLSTQAKISLADIALQLRDE